MVEPHDGSEIDLLDSSIRTTGGALVSTTLYVISGPVYAFVAAVGLGGVLLLVSDPSRAVADRAVELGTRGIAPRFG